ncbi:MAG: hypothetical protein H7Z41_02180 [Cytophagales bacterium]|nr:hypothetical protein [Armatimonadota bacterium]
MSFNRGGESRSRRRRKKDDYVTPFVILAAMILALFYLWMRWRDNRITRDEISTVSLALGIAAICFVCYLPGVQDWFDRREHERKDAEQRRFWEKREAKERVQRLKQEEAEADRAERRARRREAAEPRPQQEPPAANPESDKEPEAGSRRPR